MNMFEFLFKRSVNPASVELKEGVKQGPDQCATLALDRQSALTQAGDLGGNEAAAADFILQCQFAEARLKAAHHIHSKPGLERVAQAIRNTDRRVARLMQQRLDAILQQEAREQKAGKCIKEAQRLVEERQLMLNQVADLDRAWQSVGDVPASARELFDSTRSLLRERLEAQTALQRAVIDVRGRLQHLIQVSDASQLVPPAQIAQTLDSLEQELNQYCAAPEAPSLPRHLITEFEEQHRSFRQTLASMEKRHAAILAHEEAIAGWEAAPVDTLEQDDLKRAWRALPVLHEADAHLFKPRFDALIDRIGTSRKPKETALQGASRDIRQHFTEILDGMEKALDNGALHIAAEQDKILRAIDLMSVRLSPAQSAQLAKARNELSRLQSWAKWGGNISREELLKAAEDLPDQALAISELAKKTGSLRERWKSLDASAGPAGRDLWRRFDAACTLAYAPVAVHFKQMGDERRQNLEKARSMIAEVREFAAASNCANADAAIADWKAIAGYCARMTQLWKRLGPIDRKEKKSADAEFAAALRALSEPLAAQQQAEIRRREKLISDAAGLNPADRGSIETLRTLQERWQEQAKSLPLERNDEQALWQRFRAACDAVFASRKEAAQAADADRQQHLQTKEKICAELEAAAGASDDAILKVLRDARDAWNKTGPVPHASERRIDARYEAAIKALQTRLEQARRSAAAARFDALRDRMALCHQVENKIAGSKMMDESGLLELQAGWQTLPSLSAEFERALNARFDAAITALKTSDSRYAALLEQNRSILAHALLRLEISMGIDSPPELSRERLQLQVEVLQSSLKAGREAVTADAVLLQLCGLPALADERIGKRFDEIIARFKNGEA